MRLNLGFSDRIAVDRLREPTEVHQILWWICMEIVAPTEKS